jgi:hypothetical protein
MLAGCYQLGYEAGRYISLERLIEENKERYYETLESSSQGSHEAKHDSWPLVNFLLYVLKLAYGEFERRMWQKGVKGEETEVGEVLKHVADFKKVYDLEYDPGGWYPGDEGAERR